MTHASSRIAVYDSGIGGITVLAELRARHPQHDYVYFGDNANLPYGTKSAAQIDRLSRESARSLKALDVDAVVVACNTISAHALDAIREELPQIPVLGVVRPGVEAILAALSPLGDNLEDLTTPILVLATGATVRSQAYGKLIRSMLQGDMPGKLPLPIIEQACPLFVPMIEEGWVDHPILQQTIQEYVGMHVKTYEAGIVLLGCTHYPWIQAAIQKALPGWQVINSAQAVAEAFARERIGSKRVETPSAPKVRWIFTDPSAVPAFARKRMEALSS